MTLSQTSERTKLKQEKGKEAIALAMESRWEEAVRVNRFLIQHFSDDVETYNRLGKALFEMGNISEAREAFQKSLELAPANAIARKNLMRLGNLQDQPVHPKKLYKLTPHLFIEESGKTTVTTPSQVAGRDVLARLSAGDPVVLKVRGNSLAVEDVHGNYLGMVESRLGLRLIRLMDGGNRYEAAIIAVTNREVAVMIREMFRHPSQQGIVSFPMKEMPPILGREALPGYDLDEEEDEESAARETSPLVLETYDEDGVEEPVARFGKRAIDEEPDDQMSEEEDQT